MRRGGSTFRTRRIATRVGSAVRRRRIFSARLLCRYYIAFKFPWSGSGRNRGFSHIHRCPLLRIAAGGLHLLRLSSYRTDVSRVCGSLLFRCWACVDPTLSTVIGNMIDIFDDDPGVVNVVDLRHIHIQHSSVIEKVSVIPTSSLKAVSEITETVINSTVKAYLWTPIAVVEDKPAATPTPVAGRPQKPNFGRHYPRAGNPVVIIVIGVPSPVPWGPEIAVARAYRLFVNRQRWRPERHGNADLRERCR